MKPAALRLALVAEIAVLAIASVGLYRVFGDEPDGQVAASVRGSLRTDHFDRNGPSPGHVPGGPAWQVVSGRWVVADGRLTAPDPPPTTGAAVLLRSSRDGSIRATIGNGTRGWGLAVRWSGPDDHWFAEIVPKEGGYRLVHVERGVARVVGTSGRAPLAPGTRVTLSARGSSVTLVVAGLTRITATDPHPAGTRVGVVLAPGGVGGAAWDDVAIGGPDNVVFPPADDQSGP